MKLLIPALLLLGGCATTSSIAHGPNGRPLHHIEGVLSPTKAYERAGEKCPDGYDILTNRQQGLFTVLEIECR